MQKAETTNLETNWFEITVEVEGTNNCIEKIFWGNKLDPDLATGLFNLFSDYPCFSSMVVTAGHSEN